MTSNGPTTTARAALAASTWLLLLWAVSAQFVFNTSSVSRDEPATVVAAAAIATAIALVAVFGVPRRSDFNPQIWLGALAGFAAFGAAPYLVLANRHSDAPAGAIVLFITTAVWGLLLAAGGGLATHRAGHGLSVAGVVLAVAGAAGVLANWERPSSFNLIVRFPSEQAAMALAGLLWAAGILVILRQSLRAGLRPAAAGAALGSAVAGLIMLVLAGPSTVWSSASSGLGMSAMVSSAAVAVLALWVASRVSAAAAAIAFVAAPTALSALTIVEQAVGALGPRPMLVPQVLWASSVVIAAGALAAAADLRLARASDDSEESALALPATPRLLATVGRILAVLAVLAAITALATPALDVAVQGLRTDMSKFTVDFVMLGYETVGAWIVVGMAAVTAGWWFGRPKRDGATALLTFLTTAIALAAWFSLKEIPMHTWVTWIPPEVQQDYGTEFARIRFTGVPAIAQWVSLAAALASATLATVTPQPASPASGAKGESE